MSELTYDRRVPPELVAALARGGPMHGLVKLVLSELGKANGLDLRLRARVGHTDARATLYLGLTQVLQIHRGGRGRFKLKGQGGEGFKKKLNPKLFKDAWSRSQPLEELADQWPDVMAYVEAAIKAAPAKYLSTEGKAQARLARETKRFVTIDREVVVAFANDKLRKAAMKHETGGVDKARKQLAKTEAWAKRKKKFGAELDLLAVDTEGRVLVVEVKHGSDTAGVGWTPAQVAVYLALMQRWADATPDAADVLQGMLQQYEKLGLARKHIEIARPLQLRPVIAIAEPITNPRVANQRMRQVVETLHTKGVRLEDLGILVVDEQGKMTERELGQL